MASAMDSQSYLSNLIGQPWQSDGLHCWALVRQVVGDLYGVELPAVLHAPTGRRTKSDMFNTHPARAGWVEVQLPQPWAVALMHRRGSPRDIIEHAGVYLPIDGGGVLHVDNPHGVVFDSLFDLPRIRCWATPVLLAPA